MSLTLKNRLCGLLIAPLSIVLLTGVLFSMAAEPTTLELRKEADAARKAGNYKDALEKYRKLIMSENASGDQFSTDLSALVECLGMLQQWQEVDGLLKTMLEKHPENWEAYRNAANTISSVPHFGFIVAGEFTRGNQRGGGAYIDVSERDRSQSLVWMNTAMLKLPEGAEANQKSLFYRDFANMLKNQEAWKLQDLTDLQQVIDYPEGVAISGRFRRGVPRSQPQGAPVDEEGNPVFIQVPDSFENAKTDGERWRWCLQQSVEFDPSRKSEVDFQFAIFLHQQFGVQTLRDWGIQLPREDGAEKLEGIWSLPGLGEDETIARLANGVKRFKLPDEFNPIAILKKIAQVSGPTQGVFQQYSLDQLASIFLDRQQFEKAASYYQESIKRFPNSPDGRQAQLDQIIKNWGQFEPTVSTAAGSGATVDFRFRNAKQVSFTAHLIKIPELIADVQKYIETKPEQLDWQQMQIEQIGYSLVNQKQEKYLGEKVAEWSLELSPREKHFDRLITVTTPLQKGGAYLVTAKVADGNTTNIVLWLNDTSIVKKALNQEAMYFIADAKTGAPIEKANVQFFGYQQVYDQIGKRYNVQTQKFAEFSNADGMVIVNEKLASSGYNWMATVKSDDGRFAYLGFNGVWYSDRYDEVYQANKTYIVTDRPVYRPDQKVEFKFWVREAKYDLPESSKYADKKFRVKIQDPQGVEVYAQEYVSDAFGGFSGFYSLPVQAALGSYQIYIDTEFGRLNGTPEVSGSLGFRVEEYKKPEFEVTVEAPTKPVQLGDKITATIKAKYFYGAPVTKATVKFKVERSTHDASWFPVDRWDWLYGNGYWWFERSNGWYPGFNVWGCTSPRPSWAHWNQDPPELVLDQEVEIGADGTVQIEIDSSIAKAIHGDEDHEYSITAEVVDASRRTIVGSGKVLVAREPFQIIAWTDRGYYNVGDKIEASFQARTLDGKGIEGTGKLKLLKVTYKDGKPVEEAVKEWEVTTNADGAASQVMEAAAAGQYRLSYKLQSEENGPVIEGGHLFVIRGDGFNGSDFKFSDLELVLDKKNYAPGDKVQLLVNTNRAESTVLLFVRPSNGVAAGVPQVLRLDGKSTLVELEVALKDMPNFFVEAITVSNGKLHNIAQEIMVPPAERVLNVEVIPSSESYLPGSKAEIEVKVTDATGEPVVGAVLLSVYDRAVEYISGGSNVSEIKEFFWKWRRHHSPSAETNLGRWSHQILADNTIAMQLLGAFGDSVLLADFSEMREEKISENYKEDNNFGGRKMLRSRAGAGGAEFDAPQAAPMMMMDGAAPEAAMAKGQNGPAGGGADATTVAPTVRTNFADTAFWKADIVTDKTGIAKVTFDMPENLSSWKIRAWGMGAGTNVGESTREVVTAKNLVVRLQAPRFFVETDEVVLSAVVHNYLKSDKQVQVVLELAGDTLRPISDDLKQTVTIAAGGEHRIDWKVKAVAPGEAAITMKALTDEESDAMQMKFPVIVHGILKTESYSGIIRPDATSGSVKFTVPEERNAEQSRIEIRYSPTLAGAMVDALPYLADYPYGCTEQTLNRFVPTVITQKILLDMGMNLKAIQEKRTNLNAQEIGDPAERAKRWKQFDRNPVFSEDELSLMVKTGVKDLAAMQNDDGGWGWFSGFQERSYPHTTAVVVHGLQIAAKNDVALVDGMLDRGIAWLKSSQDEQVALLQEGERHTKDPTRKERYKQQVSDLDVLVFSILVDAKVENAEMQRFLYRDRNKVSLYSQALFGLALHELQAIEQRNMVIKNIDQFMKVDEENQTAYIDLPNNNAWWYWYSNTVEANAQYLKLLSRVDAKNPKAAGLVKYLINNRKNGTYWNSTRDTAYCIEALAEYLKASGEGKPNMVVEVLLDGELKQSVEITPEVLFSFNGSFVLEGEAVTSGEHTVELRRKSLDGKEGPLNPLYFNAYVTNFTKEEFITAAGLEIKVGRKFYRLIQDKDAKGTVAGSRGEVVDQAVLKYKREELASLSEVVSGDLVEIELEIDSKNDYEYVIFEDMKAAGCEPVDLQSGYTSGGLGAYVEFRDEKVAFFLRQLSRGKHSVSYRVRAEVPGKFSALPTKAHAMYSPELRANSDEMKLIIGDLPEKAASK
ncbi:alpha-2-macroglobulin family protein [Planctomicrobium sp. SH668]|uniref:alpha-2-macroglobulin family protein n=1 Tax=Planctomicrobium sp. SH668 TaxID=3448126 RepID=UPI003F5B4D46